MKKHLIIATVLAAAAPATAFAQDSAAADSPGTEATAPDGTPAYGIEPYVGVLGRHHSFDRDSEFGASRRTAR